MGTSSDFPGGKGQDWSNLRRAATDFAKSGETKYAERILSRFVAALGGAAAATAASAATIGSTQRMADVVAALGEGGVEDALQRAGLEHLVGQSRWDVLGALVEEVAGAAAGLQEAAIQSATVRVFEDLFPDQESWDEIAAMRLDEQQVQDVIERFVGECVFGRLSQTIDERLSRYDPHERDRRNDELHEMVTQLVKLRLDDRSVLEVDWRGDEGRQLTEGIVGDVFSKLEALTS
jgi:hypothetical protein